MTRAKRPLISLVIAAIAMIALGLVIWKIPPSSGLVELAATILLAISLLLGGSWVIGNSKRGIQVTLAIVGLLLMRRLGILDLLTVGMWLIVVGLISLVN
jgi:hypothetical protein